MEGTCFIGCSKTKRAYPCEARNMYQGTLFKKSLKYAMFYFPDVYILSAKYHVLSLNTIIEPYDLTLSKFTKNEYSQWVEIVKHQIENLQPPFTFLCGSLYHKEFIGNKPLSGLSQGYMLQYFNQRLTHKLTNFKFFTEYEK